MPNVVHQLISILTKKQKAGLLFLLMGSFLVAAMDTAMIALMAPFMTMLMDLSNSSSSMYIQTMEKLFGERSLAEYIEILCVVFIVGYLIRGLLKLGYNFWQARLIAVYRAELSLRLFRCTMYRPYAYHLQHNTAETQRLVANDVGSAFALLSTIVQTFSSALVAGGVFLVLIAMNWKLTIVVIVAIAVVIEMFRKLLKPIISKYAQMNFSSSAEMTKWVNQSIGGLKYILVGRRQDYHIACYQKAAMDAAISNSNFYAVDAIPKVLIDTLCMIMIFGIVFVSILEGQDIMSQLAVFATFALAAIRLIPVAGQISGAINTVGYYKPSLNAVYMTLQDGAFDAIERAKIEEIEDKNLELKNHVNLTKGIKLEHIGFRYDDAETPLYTDLNLTIPAKSSVAFIGVTGSGKTTLADLILGLHQPFSGKITADGVDIAENPRWWSSMIGYIPQFIYLCDDTIRANVAFGINEKEINDVQVWDCLERTQLKSFVKSLPHGLDTQIGENGMRLSGGQRQRIGIARALYNKPQFLLMDEATSALDGETEKAIVDSINALSGNITLLIIAHRLSTIKDCDIVYRIENGLATVERRGKDA